MTGLRTALASPDQSAATYAALAQRTIGARLFTLMEIDSVRGVARRCCTGMQHICPPMGEEPGPWFGHAVSRHRLSVANSTGGIAAVFSDHSLIRSLGCESCLNLPASSGATYARTLGRSRGAQTAGVLAFPLAASIRQGD